MAQAAASPEPGSVDIAAVQAAVLAWSAARSRPVAVRERRDPYAVLVAECMAHQTQIERVGEAWRAFLAAFPSIEALARARPADVLRAWGNLGYNRRAIALHRAARVVIEKHGGVVPSDPAVLAGLPGIGPYTARAVAAIAYGRRVGPVDTNVGRVLGRLLDPGGRAARRTIQATADALAAGATDPAAWTYALMDLGATVCRPIPRCDDCPLAAWCAYRAAGTRGVRSDRRPPRAPSPSGARRRTSGSPSRRGVAFPATRRWLRGRILERLRAESSDRWVRIDGPIGEHGPAAVDAALAALEAEALLERHPNDPTLARLPLA